LVPHLPLPGIKWLGPGALPPPVSHPPEFLLFSPWLFFLAMSFLSPGLSTHWLSLCALHTHQMRHVLQPLAPSLGQGGPLPSPRGLSRASRDISCLNAAPMAGVCLAIASMPLWPPARLGHSISLAFPKERVQEKVPALSHLQQRGDLVKITPRMRLLLQSHYSPYKEQKS